MRVKICRVLLIYWLLLFFAAGFLLPILLTLTNSFMSAFEVTTRYGDAFTAANIFSGRTAVGVHFAEISFIPDYFTLRQYARFLFDSPFYLGLFFNSLKITLPIVAGQVILSVPAAYAFEICQFKFKETLFFVYIVLMLLPLQVTIVPNFIIAEAIHINGSYWAIILPAVCSPFGVFLMRQFMKGIPREYVEAAKTDGAGAFKAFYYVILPLLKPAVATLSILVFVEYWNLVDQAVVFIQESVAEPLSVYLAHMSAEADPMVFAASCFYMLPVVLVFILGQEYMIEGIQLSGIR